MTTPTITAPKKLIEVALPLDEINKAAAREKSIRHGHPSALHMWWSRKPVAVARAIAFAQVVNDPSWRYTDEELKKNQIKGAVTKKRNELFKLIAELVQWENTTNEDVLERARKEIRASWKETCEANRNHPDAKTLFDPRKLPVFHDPFAGGGTIPLEAQRLGFEAHASDLNPVAVVINKAMIEIPPKFAAHTPVGPIPNDELQTKAEAAEDWSGAKGLAEDVRRYGAWLYAEAERRIGQLYPKVTITKTMVKARGDLAKYEGRQLPIVAWLWARTVRSPNPAMNNAEVPLLSSWALSKKPGRRIWTEPTVKAGAYSFRVRSEEAADRPSHDLDGGTKEARGANFRCLLSGAAIPDDYVKREGMAGRMGLKLRAIVCDGDRERVYLDPTEDHERLARSAIPSWRPSVEYAKNSRHMTPHVYGLGKFSDLFTLRQLKALTTFSDLVKEAKAEAVRLARAEGGDAKDDLPLDEGGLGARAYGDAIGVYLTMAVNLLLDDLVTLASWRSTHGTGALGHAFTRQAIAMTWDFPEANPFAGGGGDFGNAVEALVRGIELLPAAGLGKARLVNACAQAQAGGRPSVISTDPPYYDNVPYADLSDFFYVWLRKNLRDVFPDLFATLLVPKDEELVADPFRQGSKEDAETFFLSGMSSALGRIAKDSHPAVPVTVYYAFKQSETDSEKGTASTGWETFLESCVRNGFRISGTWPMRTERAVRVRSQNSNALASSIVLVLRQRGDATSISRKEFLREVQRALGPALREMTSDPAGAIVPVDLAQAAIGPGMAIFSKYKAVLEADGSPMSVHNALIHINKAVDDHFSEAEGELDADTRFCIGWFQQRGFEAGPFGEADVLARAKGTAVDGVEEAGVLDATKGKVRLLRIKEYPKKWDPRTDNRVPVWEACHQMCRALGESEHEAGTLLARMPEKQDAIRQLAYRLYTLCERNKWAEEARPYNELITSWPAIVDESHKVGHKGTQLDLI
jgi:putative DNA methylase